LLELAKQLGNVSKAAQQHQTASIDCEVASRRPNSDALDMGWRDQRKGPIEGGAGPGLFRGMCSPCHLGRDDTEACRSTVARRGAFRVRAPSHEATGLNRGEAQVTVNRYEPALVPDYRVQSGNPAASGGRATVEEAEPAADELVPVPLVLELLPLVVLGAVWKRTCLVPLSQHFAVPEAAPGEVVVVEVWAATIPTLPATRAAAINPIPVIRIGVPS